MMNWITADKNLIQKTVNAAMGELDSLISGDYGSNQTANYWLDERHNIFAVVNSSCNEMWIELHYELYGVDEDLIGDLIVFDTSDMSRDSLEEEVTSIVEMYFGE